MSPVTYPSDYRAPQFAQDTNKVSPNFKQINKLKFLIFVLQISNSDCERVICTVPGGPSHDGPSVPTENFTGLGPVINRLCFKMCHTPSSQNAHIFVRGPQMLHHDPKSRSKPMYCGSVEICPPCFNEFSTHFLERIYSVF